MEGTRCEQEMQGSVSNSPIIKRANCARRPSPSPSANGERRCSLLSLHRSVAAAAAGRIDCNNCNFPPDPQREGDKMLRVFIEPPDSGVFFSGCKLRGSVLVETETERKFKYIHISLTGRAQVLWVGEFQPERARRERECLHETQLLWIREEQDHTHLPLFPAGSHNFPFQFLLPSNLPSSFEGRVGWVRYELLGRIVTAAMNVEHSVEIVVPVMEIIDVNLKPHLLVPKSVQVSRRVWCFPCTLAQVAMAVSLTRTGFCVGDDIPMNVAMENGSRYEVTVTATLTQKVTYEAEKSKRQFDKATVVMVASQRIGPRVSTIWPTNLRVPLTEATTQDHHPINISYRLKVVASVGWGQTLVARIPVTIGNIPLKESAVDKDIHNSRDHLQRCPSNGHSFCSHDDRSLRQLGLDSQLEHTITWARLSQESCDLSSSCFHDDQYTYSVQEYVDGGNLSDDDL